MAVESRARGTPPTSKISHGKLLATIWVLAGIAAVLFAARIAVRLSFFRRLFTDDAFALVAFLILIGHGIVTTLMAPAINKLTIPDNRYELLALEAGQAKVTPALVSRMVLYLKLQFAATVLFWSCLWAVKGCFLAFFFKMTEGLRPQRTMLWVVVGIASLSYLGSVITYPISCSSFEMGACNSELNVERSLISLRYSTALDIITDVLIMAIPVWLCWQIRISLRQKLGLYSVLCLGIVIIIFSVARIIVTNTDSVHPEPSWLATWSAVEASVAVIVVCLSSFKAILTKRSRQTAASNSNGRYYHKQSQGADARSERGQDPYHARPCNQIEEEHKMRRYPADASKAVPSATLSKVTDAGRSEESIPLADARQTSLESQTGILHKPRTAL